MLTHGVEQEIQVVDRNGILQNRVRELMDEVPKSLSGRNNRKFIKDAYLTQLEITTGITKDLDDLKSELIYLRMLGHEAAESHDLFLIATGTNPFTPSRTGENFAEHHHLGCKSSREKVTLHNFIREFTPELMAFSVNSPLYLPENNGKYESFRASRNPHIRYTPRISHDKYLKGTSLDFLREKRYLDVSPFTKGNKPTVEVRLFDVQLTVPHSIVIGTLLEAIAMKSLKYVEENRIPPRVSPDVIQHNRREAIKNGLRAKFIADQKLRYSMEFMYHRQGYTEKEELPAFECIEHMLIFLEDELEDLGVNWKKDKEMKILRESLKYRMTSADCQKIVYEKFGKETLKNNLIEWTKEGSKGKPLDICKIKEYMR